MLTSPRICAASTGNARRQSGFTLLEVMIAGIIITIALFGFAVALIAAADLRVSSRQTTIATNAARFALEEIEAIEDIDYVTTNLNQWCFNVTTLDAPVMTKALPDGSLPDYHVSATLPALDGAGSPPDPADPAATDTVLMSALDGSAVALEPATDAAPATAFGTVTIDATNADFIVVEVSVYFRTKRGTRMVSFHTHMLRPVDVDDFEF